MATPGTISQFQSGGLSRLYRFDPCFNNLNSMLSSNSDLNYWKNRKSAYKKSKNGSRMLGRSTRVLSLRGLNATSHGKTKHANRLEYMRCKCQHAESASGMTTSGWESMCLPLDGINNAPNGSDLMLEQEGLTSNVNVDASGTTKDKTVIEEEAWDLLRASIVYYCGQPVGTIAANDPTSTSILNYDQVFIRDFIPSGIAFLLKGEYDIVRNFILYTLQLQSWEKTMDCYSPGQGLMPASFKVRTVPLDGDDSSTEEVLDPDFGEAAIGRVAPVDSG